MAETSPTGMKVRVASNSLATIEYPGYFEQHPRWFFDIVKKRPNAIYVLQDLPGGCSANCAYCTQARSGPEELKRGTLCNYDWPTIELDALLAHLKRLALPHVNAFCVQTIFHPESFANQLRIVERIHQELPDFWITTASTPRTPEELSQLRAAGLEGVCLCFEAATPALFDRIKGHGVHGPYRWEKHVATLRDYNDAFPATTMTHLMIGLGETEREAVEFIASMVGQGTGTSLFPYLPVEGTQLVQNLPPNAGRPDFPRWRRLQVAHFLLEQERITLDQILFDDGRIVGFDMPYEELMKVLLSGAPFMKLGCKYCSRFGYAEDRDPKDFQPGQEPYVFVLPPMKGTVDRIFAAMALTQPTAP